MERVSAFFRQHPAHPSIIHTQIMMEAAKIHAMQKILVSKGICTEDEFDKEFEASLKLMDEGIIGGKAEDLK